MKKFDNTSLAKRPVQTITYRDEKGKGRLVEEVSPRFRTGRITYGSRNCRWRQSGTSPGGYTRRRVSRQIKLIGRNQFFFGKYCGSTCGRRDAFLNQYFTRRAREASVATPQSGLASLWHHFIFMMLRARFFSSILANRLNESHYFFKLNFIKLVCNLSSYN